MTKRKHEVPDVEEPTVDLDVEEAAPEPTPVKAAAKRPRARSYRERMKHQKARLRRKL